MRILLLLTSLSTLVAPVLLSAEEARSPREAGIEAFELYLNGETEAGVELAWVGAVGGDSLSQYILGDSFFFGRGAERSYERAFKWYGLAADQGVVAAVHALAGMYGRGDFVEADQDQAIDLYRQAAEAGYAAAQFDLAARYQKGFGVEQDTEEALYWYREAERQGHEGAANNLARMLAGETGTRETRELLELREAALSGDPDAQIRFARSFATGRLADRDVGQVLHWLRAASDQGHEESIALLEGLEQPSDLQRAVILDCFSGSGEGEKCVTYGACVDRAASDRLMSTARDELAGEIDDIVADAKKECRRAG